MGSNYTNRKCVHGFFWGGLSRADGPKEQSFRSGDSSGRKKVTLESKGDYLEETASPDRFITRRKAQFLKRLIWVLKYVFQISTGTSQEK